MPPLRRACVAIVALLLGAGAAAAADATGSGGLKGLAPDLDALAAPQPPPAGDPLRQGPRQLPSGAIAVGARWLEAEIKQDYVAAADRYKGKVLQVTGAVTSKALKGDDVELSVTGDPKAERIVRVLCTIKDPASRTAGSNAVQNHIVTMVGKVTEIRDASLADVIARLDDCIVLTGHADPAAAEAQIAERAGGTATAAKADKAAAEGTAPAATAGDTAADEKQADVKRGIAFYVSASGDLLTNEKSVTGCRALSAPTAPDRPLAVVRLDPVSDLALLKLPGAVPAFARFRAARDLLAVGDVVRFPRLAAEAGASLEMTDGVVSALHGGRNDTRLLMVSVPRQRGDSGAPLLDEAGDIAGLVVGVAAPEGSTDTTATERSVVVQELLQRFLGINGVRYETATAVLPAGAAPPAGVPAFAIEIACEK